MPSSKTTTWRRNLLDFDLDRHLNPYIPHNRLSRLPKAISRWLGYRQEPQKEPLQIAQWPITFLATVAGLCLIGGIDNYAPGIAKWHPPVMIASMGASAVLDFNTIKSPLAQPRNSIIGNTLAAICGVAIAKLFQHNSGFENIEWVSGAVGCALASWVMSVTNTIHPPGGATAVLASTQVQVISMGWKFVPIVMLDSTLMVTVALLFNNVLRQYPMYWWTPATVGRKLRRERRDEEEKAEKEGDKHGEDEKDPEKMEGAESATSDSSSDRTLQRELSNRVDFVDGLEDIHITAYRIQMPHHIKLDPQEVSMLVNIQERIRMHGEINAP